MNARIISTSHTVGIDKTQLDIFYFFESHTMEVFIEGDLFMHAQFSPARAILSYTNVIDVAVFYYETYSKKKRKEELNQQKDEAQ